MEITYGNPLRQYLSIKKEIDTAMDDCIERSSFIGGYWHDRFEAELENYLGTHAALAGSGTASQHLALLACGIGPGDEVIVPSMTFFSTAETVSQTGATPVFVDISFKDYCVDPTLLESLVTSKTRAFMPVDLYGQQCDYHTLALFCAKHDLHLIQDSAQSFGSRYYDLHVGEFADLAIHSFYPGKNLDCMGDAGAVTGNQSLIEHIRELRNHCRGASEKYLHTGIGWNHRCDGLQAAILSVKLKHIDTWNEQRRQNAEHYNYRLKDTDLILPTEQFYNKHVYNQYCILCPNRDQLALFLDSKGVKTGKQFPRGCHSQPAYDSPHVLPNTEYVAETCLSLPVWPGLTEGEIDYICENVLLYLDSK